MIDYTKYDHIGSPDLNDYPEATAVTNEFVKYLESFLSLHIEEDELYTISLSFSTYHNVVRIDLLTKGEVIPTITIRIHVSQHMFSGTMATNSSNYYFHKVEPAENPEEVNQHLTLLCEKLWRKATNKPDVETEVITISKLPKGMMY